MEKIMTATEHTPPLKNTPVQHQSLKKLVLALVITLSLPLLFPIASSQAAPKFRPAKRQAPQRTESTGTRSTDKISRTGDLKGCAQDLAIPLTLLVPEEMAQTSSARPSLFWYLASKKDVSIAFYELPEKGGKKLLWRKAVKVEQPGIAQLTFPTEQPELAIGKVYAWSVDLVCDSDKPDSTTTIVQAQLERVAPSQWLQAQLNKATNDQRRAELYATSGQWYDTLGATANALASDPEDKTVQQDLLSLIEQVGLKTIADREK
jgi:Domain of Unknown Function (DUF928)